MSVWLRAPVLRLMVFFIPGIFVSGFLDHIPHWLFVLVLVFILCFLALRKLSYHHRYFSGLLIGASGLLLGALMNELDDVGLDKERAAIRQGQTTIVEGKVASAPKTGKKTTQIQIDISRLYSEGNVRQGPARVIIYLEKDSLDTHENLQMGQKVVLQTEFRPMSAPLNPGEFDYRQFMERRGIFYSAYCRSQHFRVINQRPEGLLSYFESIRQKLICQLESSISGREKDVVIALVLGDKSGLDSATSSSFKAAGTMHVLAVSGLHVGLIFVLLTRVLGFLPAQSTWRFLRLGILIAGLWSYAMLTGLSPSVLRAATMFSFLALGEIFGRKTNSYNLLACAALLMLCINPKLIYELGFQLSYLAVLGILFIQPILAAFWKPRWKAINWIWQLGTVSLAAQLATFPITVFHFHSFPNYFLLANLAVVPLATIVLYNAIGFISLQFVPGLGEFLGWCLLKTSGLLIDFVAWIEYLPHSQTTWLHLTAIQAILAVIIVWAIASWLSSRRAAWMLIAASSLLLTMIDGSWLLHKTQSQQQLVIHHIEKESAISILQGRHGTTFSWPDDDMSRHRQMQEAFMIDKGIRHPALLELPDRFEGVLELNGLRILKITGDSSGTRVPLNADVIWLADNPTVNWKLWKEELGGVQIVVDGSCSRYWVRKQLELAHDAGFEPYITRERGAWVLSSAVATALQPAQRTFPNDSIR